MLKFCKKCGTSVPAQTTFCKKCGSQVKQPGVGSTTSNAISSLPMSPNMSETSMSTPLICNKCSSQIKSGAKFCSKCASPAVGSMQTPQNPLQSVMSNVHKSLFSGMDKNMIVRLGAGAAIVLVFFVIVVLITNNNGGDNVADSGRPAVSTETSNNEAETPSGQSIERNEAITGTELLERYAMAVFTVYAFDPWEGGYIGWGSGFIIDPSGIAVTADHVLAPSMRARLHDGTFVNITSVFNYDPIRDLAVIQLAGLGSGRNHTAVRIGDSDTVAAGNEVFAIGTTLGVFHNTFTAGHVSAIIPEFRFENYILTNAIQISAATYGGNSGGPVFSSSGEVIGVLVAGPGGIQTIGITSPINALDISPQGLSNPRAPSELFN